MGRDVAGRGQPFANAELLLHFLYTVHPWTYKKIAPCIFFIPSIPGHKKRLLKFQALNLAASTLAAVKPLEVKRVYGRLLGSMGIVLLTQRKRKSIDDLAVEFCGFARIVNR